MSEQQSKGRSKRLWGMPVWAVAALAAVLLAGAGFGAYQLLKPARSSASGECVAVTGADDAAEVRTVDCAADEAAFKLASTRGADDIGCPEGAYREVRAGSDLLCLMPNFVADTCYEADDANSGFKVADCSSQEAIRVSEVIEGTTDPSGCPDGSGLGYPEPPVVFCIETPGV